MTYHVVFLIINMVLIINFIIAILTDTYKNFIQYSEGLYCNELINAFPCCDFDETYGFMVCAIPPFNVIIPAVMPIVAYTQKYNSKNMVWLNNTICKILYAPFALSFGLVFFMVNILIIPFSYFTMIGILSTMPDKDKSFVSGIFELLSFIILGPIVMVLSIFVDEVVFVMNLYVEPKL